MVQKATSKKKVVIKKVAAIKPKLGDVVKWTSQSGGHVTTKQGKVIAVLRANINYTGFWNIPLRVVEADVELHEDTGIGD